MTGESDPTMTCMTPPLRLSTISESKCADHNIYSSRKAVILGAPIFWDTYFFGSHDAQIAI